MFFEYFFRCELIVRFTGDAPITPKILKERKEKFHKVLLERTKDYHEEFLKNLSPPMHVNKDDLKRWHPDFMVSDVPDIPPKKLPQLPIFKQATVTDVLGKLACNKFFVQNTFNQFLFS